MSSDNQHQEKASFVVGIGASAGGLDAMRQLVAEIPEATPMAFIVVQHLAESPPDILGELLSKVSAIPISLAEDKMALRAGHIYVAPPQSIVTVDKSKITARHVETKQERRRTIDPMFTSLARAYGPAAVGVILSGNDADGTAGLQEISQAGGLTISQSPDSAEFSAMPISAIESGIIDQQLAPADIPAKLDTYHRDLTKIREIDEKTQHDQIVDRLDDVAKYVRRETGHDFAHYKTSTLVRRIQRRMRVLHFIDIDDYVGHLGKSAEEARTLFNEILINVTSFFRDSKSFEKLAEGVLPKLVRDHDRGDPIRIWVPGCATGQEAYTIAILMRETLDDIAPTQRPDVKIFATDISSEALRKARQGRYPIGASAGLSNDRLRRFFTVEDEHFVVNKSLRNNCLFAEHNIIRDPPFIDLDLISCRNLLIYLNADLQKQVLLLFHHALRHKGFLFLGSSETVNPQSDLFRAHASKHRIWQNTSSTGSPRPDLPITGSKFKEHRATFYDPDVSPDGDLNEQFRAILADEYAPRAVLVRRDGSIVYASDGMERYLQILRGKFHNTLLKMVNSGLRIGLRAALGEATETGQRAISDDLTFKSDEGLRSVRLTVEPMPATKDSSGLYLVVFEELPPPAEEAQRQRIRPDENAEKLIQQLENELENTRTNLEHTVQELETANEELKSSNEELRSMNEELQSANEELETSKNEVVESNKALAAARNDLENLLNSSRLPTLFVDVEHKIQLFTPAMTEIYNLRPADLGRPIEELTHHIIDMPPLLSAEELRNLDAPKSAEIRATDGTWYIRRIFPYLTGDEKLQGMVVTFSDVTKLKETTEELRRRSEELDEAKRKAEAASRAKTAFLANMSHEIRTPMTAILGFTSLLLERFEGGDELKALKTIERNANFLLDIINDILDIAKIEEGNLDVKQQPVDPRELIEDLAELMRLRAREKNLELTVEIDDAIPDKLLLDPTRTHQVLLNLIGNAIKFTDEGSVTVRARFIDGETPVFRCDVIDTGIGISDQEQRQIFNAFSQSDTSASRRHEGTGLGLTISRRIADRLGASLDVESQLGEGTTFTFEVPTRRPSEDHGQGLALSPGDELEATKPGNTQLDAQVLVVDDQEDIRELLRHILTRSGATVETASNGVEALKKVDDMADQSRHYDVVVMDMQMPEMDGYETTRKLRQRGFKGSIVALTAAAMGGDAQRCLEAGCTSYLAKPIDPENLVKKLAEHVD